MSLNATEISQVVASLNRNLCGAKIREVISERDACQITLVVRQNGMNHFIRFALVHPLMRLGRIREKPRAAASPHPFVMLLRRELIGKRMGQIEQINRDRVVTLACAREAEGLLLVAELISRNANLYLTDPDGTIRGAFLPHRSNKRDLAVGDIYVPPPKTATKSPPGRFEPDETLERQIEDFYADLARISKVSTEKSELEKMVRVAKNKTDRLIRRLETDLSHAATGETLQHHGHILKTHLKAVEKGAAQLDAHDFVGQPVTIALDPKLSPVANMEKMFNKAKRLIRAVEQIENRLLAAMSEMEMLDEMASEIHDADPIQIEKIKARLIRRYPFLNRIAEKNAREPQKRIPYREFFIGHSHLARVGRSARENDVLTLRHARPNDLWLHVRGETGSHVVVPMGRNENPTPELLVDAAHLAAHFSKLKNDADVEVLYTRRRYVQKPKGAPPGAVRLIREKTIFLKIEPDKLRNILNPSKKE